MNAEDAIVSLGLGEPFAGVLREIAARSTCEIAVQAAYISIRPQGRSIAAYFNREFLDIAADPLDSARVAVQVATDDVRRKTTATHYVRVPRKPLSPHVEGEVLAALAWRERGPRWSGDTAAGGFADLAGETCGTCFLELSTVGTCGCE